MRNRFLLHASLVLLFAAYVNAQIPAPQKLPETISGGVLNGKALNLPKPEFPAAAKAVNACGAVNVQVVIDEGGNISSAEAVSGHPLLRSASENAAWEAKFNPTTLSGTPVKVSGVLAYVFNCDFGSAGGSAVDNSGGIRVIGGIDRDPSGSPTSSGTDKSINGGVVNGKALSLPAPPYPAAASAVGVSGSVSVQVLIDEEGNVTSANAVSGHPLLRSASERAALLAKFRPTLLENIPVKVSGVITYVFNPRISDEATLRRKEKLGIIGLGTSLELLRLKGLARFSAADANYLKSLASIADFPVPSGVFSPFEEFSDSTSEHGVSEMIDRVNANISGKLSGSQAWQFEFGKKFSGVLWTWQQNPTDEIELRSGLLDMKIFLANTPIDIPFEISNRFRQLANFADRENLLSPANLNEFRYSVTEIMNLVSGKL